MYELAALSSLYIFVAVAAIPVSATCQSNGKTQDQPAAGRPVTQPGRVLKVDTKRVGDLAFSPDGRTLAIGLDGGNAQLWDVKTEKLLAILPADRTASLLTFSGDGRTLATVDIRVVRLWDVTTGDLRAALIGDKKSISSAAFSPDSSMLATASIYELVVRLWDVQTGQLKATLVHPKPYEYATGVGNAAFTPDGKTLVTTSAGTVYLWDVATAKLRMKLIDQDVRLMTAEWRLLKGFSHDDTIYDLAIGPDGRTLATASRDGTAKLWDVATSTLIVTLKHKAQVVHLVFSPDGRTLATGSRDETARLWDVDTGKLKATLSGHKDTVWSISFSADSRFIATASRTTVKLWDVGTGELRQSYDVMRVPIAFSPVGRLLATGSRSKRGTVTLWDIP